MVGACVVVGLHTGGDVIERAPRHDRIDHPDGLGGLGRLALPGRRERGIGAALPPCRCVPGRLAVADEHREAARTEEVLDLLASGSDVGVVSDAGTPGISGVGFRLVTASAFSLAPRTKPAACPAP